MPPTKKKCALLTRFFFLSGLLSLPSWSWAFCSIKLEKANWGTELRRWEERRKEPYFGVGPRVIFAWQIQVMGKGGRKLKQEETPLTQSAERGVPAGGWQPGVGHSWDGLVECQSC